METSSIYLIILISLMIVCDVNLVNRVKNYQIVTKNMTEHEKKMEIFDGLILSCHINPTCNISAKGLMTDPIDFYLYHPVAVLLNEAMGLSELDKQHPDINVADGISGFHMIIGFIGCYMISKGKQRRAGVLIVEFSIFLDSLDGVIARAVKNEFGEGSDPSSMGFYIDGLCDTVVIMCIVFTVKSLLYQKKYLPISSKDSASIHIPVMMLYFILNLFFSSLFWNQFLLSFEHRCDHFGANFLRSNGFLTAAFLWRFCSCYSILHMILYAIYIDKVWSFLKKAMLPIMGLIFITCIVGEIVLIAV